MPNEYTLVCGISGTGNRYVHPHARTLQGQNLSTTQRNLDLTLVLNGSGAPDLTGGYVSISFYDDNEYSSVKPWFADTIPPPATNPATVSSPVTITDLACKSERTGTPGSSVTIKFPVEVYWALNSIPAETNVPGSFKLRISAVTYTSPLGAVTTFDPANPGTSDGNDDTIVIGGSAFVLESFYVARTSAEKVTAYSTVPVTFKLYGPPVAGGGTRPLSVQLSSSLDTGGHPLANLDEPSAIVITGTTPDVSTWGIAFLTQGAGGDYSFSVSVQFMAASAAFYLEGNYVYLSNLSWGTSYRVSTVYPTGGFSSFIPGQQDLFTAGTAAPTFYAVPRPMTLASGANTLLVDVYTPAQTSTPFTNDGTTSLFTVQARVRKLSDPVGAEVAVPIGFSWDSSVRDGTDSARALLPAPASFAEADPATLTNVATLKFPFNFTLGSQPVSVDVSAVTATVTLVNVQGAVSTVSMSVPIHSLANMIDPSSQLANAILDNVHPANSIILGSLTTAEAAKIGQLLWTRGSGSASLMSDAALVQADPTVAATIDDEVRGGQHRLFI